MRIDADTALWLVVDAGPSSTLVDVMTATNLEGLHRQVMGGLTCASHPALFTDREEAFEEAKHRLLAWKVAERIRRQRNVAADEVVRVTLHDKDGSVLWEGDVK